MWHLNASVQQNYKKDPTFPPVNKQIEGKHTKKIWNFANRLVHVFFFFDVPLKSGDRWKFCLQAREFVSILLGFFVICKIQQALVRNTSS